MPTNTSAGNLPLGLVAKCGFLIMSRAIGFGLLGLLLNLILLIFAWPEISAALDIGHAAHTSLAWVMLLFRVPFLLAMLLFILPLIYFIFGQKHGISHALHFAFSQNREFLIQFVMDKFRNFVEQRPLLTEGRASEKIPSLLENYLLKMDNIPNPLGWLVKRFVMKSNIVAAAKSVSQQAGSEQLNLAQFLSATTAEIGTSASAQAFQPSLTGFWILLSLNLVAFMILKFGY